MYVFAYHRRHYGEGCLEAPDMDFELLKLVVVYTILASFGVANEQVSVGCFG